MPDIALRFNKDMLVLSAPIASTLARQGVNVERDLEFMNIIESEAVRDAFRLEKLAGAQCLVTNTAGLAPARLAHCELEDRGREIVRAALDLVNGLAPQHAFVEVGPCGLPLDASSKSSLNENRDQYVRAARSCEGLTFDAVFLNGFENPVDLKCALMAVRQVLDVPAFASVRVDPDGTLSDGRNPLEEAFVVMAEYGASVAGFSTGADAADAAKLVRRGVAVVDLPLLAQLEVAEHNPKQGGPTAGNPYYCPDAMVGAAAELRASGVQFLRACGAATPAYTGALVATTEGFDVVISSEGW